jgi:hypothetical protein
MRAVLGALFVAAVAALVASMAWRARPKEPARATAAPARVSVPTSVAGTSTSTAATSTTTTSVRFTTETFATIPPPDPAETDRQLRERGIDPDQLREQFRRAFRRDQAE